MADRPPRSPFLGRLLPHSPTSTQAVGLLTLVISGAVLLLLTGLTITATILGLIFLTPILILTSPLWVPIAAILFVAVSGAVSLFGSFAAVSWVYRYFRGLHPVGSDQMDFARSQIASTAEHVKDYAREYGVYLHRKVKDAAPGA